MFNPYGIKKYRKNLDTTGTRLQKGFLFSFFLFFLSSFENTY
jgi:hypothetical protein